MATTTRGSGPRGATASALNFIRDVELPPPPPTGLSLDGATEPIFTAVKDQAVVVGSEVVSFVNGVDEETRKAVSDSSLLAQLVARKRVADPHDIYGWYQAYFDVLGTIGWSIQESGFAEYSEGGEGFEVHEAIGKVAAVLLGPAPAALALVTTTLDALRSMNSGSPWITIFNRESQRAKAAKFQISLVRKDPAHGLLVEMMAFGIEAEKQITQVLFFKFKEHRATLKHNVGKASLNEAALKELLPDIRARVRKFQRDWISSLPELD